MAKVHIYIYMSHSLNSLEGGYIGDTIGDIKGDARDTRSLDYSSKIQRGLPKIRGAFLGCPIIRVIVFEGLHWGPRVFGN